MVRSMFAAFCMLMVWSGAGNADPNSTAYLLSPGDVVMVSVWQEESLRQKPPYFPTAVSLFPRPGASMLPGWM